VQIPCGFLFDRFGPRLTVSGMLVLATCGITIFTLAPSWPFLLTGRVLMGAGFGAMLIGSMVVISRWFPPDRFSTLTAMVLSIGLLGNLAATTPLAWARQGLVGRPVPARGAWNEPDRGRHRPAIGRHRLSARHAPLRPAGSPAGHPKMDRRRRQLGDHFHPCYARACIAPADLAAD